MKMLKLTLAAFALAATTTPLIAQPAAPPPAAQAEPSAETIRLAVENQLLRLNPSRGTALT